MLKLTNISKDYRVGDTVTHALRNINLEFRKNEFVSVLGPSGCGKTTMLNIIGGLDRYDSGDLILDDKSTKDFKESEWDSYRNATIGFVFQNYNLISHLSVLNNVEIAMTLSGVGAAERKKRAIEVLSDVGLADQLHKRPNQLSGGQMQRVAIARALVNKPKILLADEPTGAIDSKTSIAILDILKKISRDRLVIMVTHNTELAEKYSDRIINLLDGTITHDSRIYGKDDEVSFIEKLRNKKVSMSFLTALKSSFRNLVSKKMRTIITAFAGSIGIIGIALVLAISNGMTIYVDSMQSDTLAGFPITINRNVSTTTDIMEARRQNSENFMGGDSDSDFPDNGIILSYDPDENSRTHTNIITDEFLGYLGAMDDSLYNSISYSRRVSIILLAKTESGDYVKVGTRSSSSPFAMFNTNNNFNEIPSDRDFIESQYDLLGEGSRYPEEYNEVVLIVDKKNRVSTNFLEEFGISNGAEFGFEDFLGREFIVVDNDDYYVSNGELFAAGNNFTEMAESERSMTIRIVGIMRVKESASSEILSTGIGYTTMLTDQVLEHASDSKIVEAQRQSPLKSVLSGRDFTEDSTYQNTMQLIGGDSTPSAIQIYPVSFDNKDDIKAYLDAYNTDRADEDKIIYSDLAETISGTISSLINTITVILSAFAAISLIVSSIMIGIITYVSVVERTKEIGILRSIGARKKDISRVFIAEAIIIGFTSGVFGILATAVLILPINLIISRVIEVSGFAALPVAKALGLVAISVGLTFVAGLIPSRIAARKDPVVALRTE
ncbi:MAG TPA: ATP-binding cassette domain-containing protein [Clostridia bacterium]|nr:ATP-binding cassette domain-containing protein [Clostridia bacterium]HRX41637.1 ATP-binding cassette domain-containing protein [Clostridia bacterium]